jgi:hypothetical protein
VLFSIGEREQNIENRGSQRQVFIDARSVQVYSLRMQRLYSQGIYFQGV